VCSLRAKIVRLGCAQTLPAALEFAAQRALRQRASALPGGLQPRLSVSGSLQKALTLTFAPDETESPKRCGRDCRSDSAARRETPRVKKRAYTEKGAQLRETENDGKVITR